jgi:hypothetical protein
MQALEQIIESDRLGAVMDIPASMQHSLLRVIVLPLMQEPEQAHPTELAEPFGTWNGKNFVSELSADELCAQLKEARHFMDKDISF